MSNKITKVWYNKDYFINVLSFEFSDGSRSPPAKASKHNCTNYFLWPRKIIKYSEDGQEKELNPIRKMTFLSDALLWKFSLDDKDDSPLLCAALPKLLGKKGMVMNSPMMKELKELKDQ